MTAVEERQWLLDDGEEKGRTVLERVTGLNLLLDELVLLSKLLRVGNHLVENIVSGCTRPSKQLERENSLGQSPPDSIVRARSRS